jgi:hypothetical protein
MNANVRLKKRLKRAKAIMRILASAIFPNQEATDEMLLLQSKQSIYVLTIILINDPRSKHNYFALEKLPLPTIRVYSVIPVRRLLLRV